MPSRFWIPQNQRQTLYAPAKHNPAATKNEDEDGPMARSDMYFSVVIKNKRPIDAPS
jgi:hypothetical protein